MYSRNLTVSSELSLPLTNVQPQYSDFSKVANGNHPKPEPTLKFSSGTLAPSSQPSPVAQGYIPEMSSRMLMLVSTPTVPTKSEFMIGDSMNSQKNEYCFTDSSASPSTDAAFRKNQCLSDSAGIPPPPSLISAQETSANQSQSFPSGSVGPPTLAPPSSRASTVSEALFVRIIVSRCKRIAPLWFRGISSMRERNREESRRTSANVSQTQNDWSIISRKIRASWHFPFEVPVGFFEVQTC